MEPEWPTGLQRRHKTNRPGGARAECGNQLTRSNK
jgi:hypothetical protein